MDFSACRIWASFIFAVSQYTALKIINNHDIKNHDYQYGVNTNIFRNSAPL